MNAKLNKRLLECGINVKPVTTIQELTNSKNFSSTSMSTGSTVKIKYKPKV